MAVILRLLPREAILEPGFWKTSPPVPFRPRPPRTQPATAPADASVEGAWRAALDAIPGLCGGRLDYDPWLRVLAALHHETGGSEEGRGLAHAWSSRLADYHADEVDEKWDSFDADHEGGVTGGTILTTARGFGWVAPIDAEEFGPVGAQEAPEVSSMGSGGKNGVAGREMAAPGIVDDEDHFERQKDGAIKPTVSNCVLACRSVRQAGYRIGWDAFRDEITVTDEAAGVSRAIVDADMVRIRMRLEALGFKTAGKELAQDAVMLVASENRYDSAQVWLEGVSRMWDGIRRVDGFMPKYLGVADSEYARAVGRYVWTALAGRVLDPGCQADMVVILSGEQGLRKSSAIAAIAPAREFFVEIDLSDDEEKLARVCRGTLVAELAELSGLHTKEREAIKKYVVRRHEKWVPKWKEFPTTYLRRQLFFGTTNQVDILADETGERRWLPCLCTRTDVEAIVRDRDQLWAEGALMWRGDVAPETWRGNRGVAPAAVSGHAQAPEMGDVGGGQGDVASQAWRAGDVAPGAWRGGVAWEDAETLARVGDVHADFTQEDPWAGRVGAWLEDCDSLAEDGASGAARGRRGDSPVALDDVLSTALGLSAREQGMREARRVGAILKRMGYTNKPVRIEGKQVKRWVK